MTKPSEKTRKNYHERVKLINEMEAEIKKLSDEQLRNKTSELRAKLAAGASLESLIPESFAVVREGSRRVLGLRPFDTQLIGGMVLHEGQIAEMMTGEGKTLAAILPSYLNALTGKGVHVVTVNDYLARRDSEWVGQVHRFLGLSVGLVQAAMDEDQRRIAYNADVSYVTNSELGFDYLRDALSEKKEKLVLREFNFCIIDEVDSILIDEARTPLILSEMSDRPEDKYLKSDKIAKAMVRDIHYTLDEKQRNVVLTEDGYEAAEDILNVRDIYDPRNQWATFLLNALKAKELFKPNVNYIIKEGNVVIVDEFTGRTMKGRMWSDGLHQAIEASEGLQIQKESVTIASITYQNLFRGFPKLAGMTGTALTESSEFSDIYDLEVTVVPTNLPSLRIDAPDVIFKRENDKLNAVVSEIDKMHKIGRPTLIGTTSVEKSEQLAEKLKKGKIPFQMLNAKPENISKESDIVAQSGRKSAVTVSTNMAGRGTDIILGGNPVFMARLELRNMLFSTSSTFETTNSFSELRVQIPNEIKKNVKELRDLCTERNLSVSDVNNLLSIACEKGPTEETIIIKLRTVIQAIEIAFKSITEKEKLEVVSLGGLHIIGTERHESRRIDNQLRGRAGRQGDPGSTRFFLSLEDYLFRVFGGDKLKNLMSTFQIDDIPIESQLLSKSLDEAQKKVENYFFDVRKNLFEYDKVLDTQRDRIYAERRLGLLATDLTAKMEHYVTETMDDILEANLYGVKNKPISEWPLESLAEKIREYCPLMTDLTSSQLEEHCKGSSPLETLRSYLHRRGLDAYYMKRDLINKIDPSLMQEAERYFFVSQIDIFWKKHLQEIKSLQQVVGLRGYAQRDPLTEYKIEGYNLFLDMLSQIRRKVVYCIYSFQPDTKMTGYEKASNE